MDEELNRMLDGCRVDICVVQPNRDKIAVPVAVEGQSASALIATGQSQNSIAKSFAEAIGIEPKGTYRLFLTIGGVIYGRADFEVCDSEYSKRASVVLGWGFVRSLHCFQCSTNEDGDREVVISLRYPWNNP